MEIKNVTRTTLPPFEEYCEQIRKIWDSHIMTNMGEEHERFERELKSFLGCRGLRLFANGHLALEAAVRVMNLPAGSEIITTPFTFPSTVHAVVRCGFVPVFCDVLAEDGTMDSSLAEKLINGNTSAILPVHVYGNPCDTDSFEQLASKHGLKLIFDAAHTFGVKYKGKSLVCRGDASILSFHATKVFSTIEGGAVCYSDEALSEPLENERNFGIRDYESCVAAGGNAKMNEFQAAMGICNLKHVNDDIARRQELSDCYHACLDGRPGVRILSPRAGTETNGAYLPVILEHGRDAVYEALRKEGIMCRKYFYPLVSRMECYTGRLPEGDTPVAATLASGVLALPIYPDLTPKEAEMVSRRLLLYL